MRRLAFYLASAAAAIAGGLGCGASVLIYFNLRDNDDDRWFWLLIVAALLFILCAAALAISITLSDERPVRTRQVSHPIVVGRSGAPEITDPMPGPARVRRPVSEAYGRQKRTLFKEE